MDADHDIPVWLDCDPGHDDATAILLAGHTPGLRLLGVSTIGGNQTLAKVTKNALDVLDAIGLSHISVVAGQPQPLLRPPLLCPEIHGDTGLDGPGGGRLLPRSHRAPLPGKAINVMYNAIAAAYGKLQQPRRSGGDGDGGGGNGAGDSGDQCCGGELHGEQQQDGLTAAKAAAKAAAAAAGCGGRQDVEEGVKARGGRRVRLVCTGALTNAALLLRVYPEVVEWVELVLMGGCMGVGNTGPVVEFNIQTDPEAAKIVFESGVPLTMVPLEVTHTVLATPEVLAAIGSVGDVAAVADAAGREADGTAPPATAMPPQSAQRQPVQAPISRFRHTIQQLLLFFAETYKRVFRFEHPPLHDPVAVAYVVRPDLFECRAMRVDVETCSPLSYGQTVCDVWGQSGLPPNVNVALRVDVAGFWRLLLAAVARADAVSPLNTATVAVGTAAPAVSPMVEQQQPSSPTPPLAAAAVADLPVLISSPRECTLAERQQ